MIYKGHLNSNVPSTLMFPEGRAKGAVILLHPASGSRSTLQKEGELLKQLGLAVLIPEAPFLRPGFEAMTFETKSDRLAYIYNQWIEDTKLGFEFLRDQTDLSLKQMGIVGRNLGGGMATVIASTLDLGACVVIGAIPSLARRASMGNSEIYNQLKAYDPIRAVDKISGPLLLQYGVWDDFFTRKEALEFVDQSPAHTLMKWYNEGHDLDSDEVSDDYSRWLITHLLNPGVHETLINP